MELIKATPHCGAEIRGVDLAKSLDEAAAGALARALSEHCVLFFRDQSLTPDTQKALGRRFGELHLHPAFPDILEGHPEIMVIRADENSKRIAGEDWHSDVSCDPEPPLGSILYMQEVPPAGGDTLFASMYAAYDALSPRMQTYLDGLTATHDGAKLFDKSSTEYPTAVHPVIARHPDTRRKMIYVNRGFTVRINELSKEESDAVLSFLFDHCARPEFQVRFRWRKHSIAFWDNRASQHLAIWDYYPNVRTGYRIQIKGTAPPLPA